MEPDAIKEQRIKALEFRMKGDKVLVPAIRTPTRWRPSGSPRGR
jgi:hypothetical protein